METFICVVLLPYENTGVLVHYCYQGYIRTRKNRFHPSGPVLGSGAYRQPGSQPDSPPESSFNERVVTCGDPW